MKREVFSFDAVAPARERGLKFIVSVCNLMVNVVAPARERGLKLKLLLIILLMSWRRSRKGAWIEMPDAYVWYSWHDGSLPQGSVD